MKKKAEALGMLIRAGVDPDNAAARLGMAGIQFTGMVPVNLKDPDAPAKGAPAAA
ncbi:MULTISPECIES: hypothetical protein [Rhodococcus]|uniref:hypothetical protein n=1 Tax=Rhodococcus TaxID=1827 RepID=UPI00167EEAB1|nr:MULTISPECIES: hypothetical protein [Rhodococcus]